MRESNAATSSETAIRLPKNTKVTAMATPVRRSTSAPAF